MKSLRPQTSWGALRDLLIRGVFWGTGASLLGGLLGLFVHASGLAGVLSGLNVAGTVLAVVAGSMIFGAVQTNQVNTMNQGRLGRGSGPMTLPLAPAIVAGTASGTCFLFLWLGQFLK